MRPTRSTKYRVQLIILLTIISLFGLFLYIQREPNYATEDYIEEPIFPTRKFVTVKRTSINESLLSESINCAYKVKLKRIY
jgi:hypothetical protein